MYGSNTEFDYRYVFSNLKALRALGIDSTLSNVQWERVVKVPEYFATLIHLRYLDISGSSNLTELPETLCDLCNLRTLKMYGCINLQRLPEGIGKLVKLRHLYIDDLDMSRLEGLPKGVVKLITSLEKVDAMMIPENSFWGFGGGEPLSTSGVSLYKKV